MQRISLLFLLVSSSLFATTAICQSPFFVSKHEFSPDELTSFYSSVTISGNRVFFIANDYKLYSYEKTSAEPIWCRSLNIKSNTPCFVADGTVYAPFNENNAKGTVGIDSSTGKIITRLPVETLQTEPVLKNGILYGTAIYDGGAVFAYDTKGDSLLWQKFIAHGVSTQPYYFPNYIQANAEGSNWVKLGYNGQYLDTTCKEKADIFVRDIPCINKFMALTHDGYEITEKFCESLFGEENSWVPAEKVSRGKHHSFFIYDDKLVILGNKRKVHVNISLPALLPDTVEVDYDAPAQIIGSGETTVTFLYNNRLLRYDHAKKKLERTTDLGEWKPSQAVLDDERLWLISKKDGRLYGLTL